MDYIEYFIYKKSELYQIYNNPSSKIKKEELINILIHNVGLESKEQKKSVFTHLCHALGPYDQKNFESFSFSLNIMFSLNNQFDKKCFLDMVSKVSARIGYN